MTDLVSAQSSWPVARAPARVGVLAASGAATVLLALAIATRTTGPATTGAVPLAEGDARCVAAGLAIGERFDRAGPESPDLALARRAYAMARAHCEVGRTLVSLTSLAAVGATLDRLEARRPAQAR